METASSILEERISRHGLTRKDLKSVCPRDVRHEVALKIIDWQMVGHFFNVPQEKLTAIERENCTEDQRKVTLLDTWSNREGEGASYLKLAHVLHQRGRNDLVDFLCSRILEKRTSSDTINDTLSVDHDQKGIQSQGNPPPKPLQSESQQPHSQGTTALNFSRAMTCEEIEQWLLQELGEKHSDDIKKLCEKHVDGVIFPSLTENDLKTEFGIDFASRRKISMLVKKLTEQQSSVFESQHHIQGSEETDSLESISPAMKDWCSFSGKPDPQEPTMTTTEGAQPAALPKNIHLWGKSKLLIKFKSPNLLAKWGITDTQILEWAHKWNHKCIPMFELAKQDRPDILIELNELGHNESLCGNARPAGSDDPTMWLDLSRGDDRYKEHLVVHEFGHALGLGHEHQRSDFCRFIKHYIDENRMKKDVGSRYKDWMEDSQLDDKNATPYDPNSIMHYWFETDWLTQGYSDVDKIDRDFNQGVLTKRMKEVLLGVHERAKNKFPIEPSKLDLDFLNQKYEEKFHTEKVADEDTDSCGGQKFSKTNGQVTSFTSPPLTSCSALDNFKLKSFHIDHFKWKDAENSEEELVKIYEVSAPKWETIAASLGLEEAKINNIRSDYHQNVARVKAVFGEWLDNAAALPKADKYPLTWPGLIRLLKDSQLGTLAKKVETALCSSYNEVKGTL